MSKVKRKLKRSPKKSSEKHPETAIIRIPAPAAKPWELNREEVELVKSQICKGASDLEFQMCLARARHHKLDPLKGQIWFIPRRDRSGGDNAKVWIAQVGIAGLRHIAARDHREDFGNEDEPEFGPMITVTWQWNGQGRVQDLRVPEWAKVSIWKRGASRPTVATVWWEEIYPNVDYAPLVRQMPRGMLGKCASAACHRKAYPETGGLYISEEFAAQRPDFTDTGRAIVYGDEPQHVSQLNENAAHGHAPGSPQALMAEAALKRSEEEDRKLAESKKSAHSDPEPSIHPDLTRKSDIPPANMVEALPDLPANAMQVVVDWHDKENPVVTGDADAIEALKPLLHWGKDEFWHVKAEDVRKIGEACAGAGYRFSEILPETSSGRSANTAPKAAAREGGGKPKATTAPAAETVLKGIIEQANPETGQKPRLSVLFKIDKAKYWMSSFDTTLWPYLIKGKGQEAEIMVEKRVKGDKTFINITGLKRIAAMEFEDGKVPVTSVHREPGTNPGLFT